MSITIVPNTRWAEELNKRALAASGASASLEKSAVPIKELLALHDDSSKPVISRTMRRLLLLNVMGGIKTAYFRRISKGVVEVVMNAISELKKNFIMPEELKEILSTRGGAREADLLAAYEGYEKALGSHGFKDEDDLYQNLKNIKFTEPPHLAGFDSIKPWMRSLNNGDIVFGGHTLFSTKSVCPPTIYALNSPFAEAKVVREKIESLGLAPEDIVVYLPAQSQFAWWLCQAFTKEISFAIATSPILSELFNDPNLPQEGTLKDFVLKSRETLAGLYSRRGTHTFLGKKCVSPERFEARGLAFIDTINKALKRLQFEAKELNIGSTFTKEEFLNIIGDEVNAAPLWPVNLPFRLVSWEDAGLYEHKVAIMPQMNEGIFPPTGARISFFSEPDTLSPRPDARIEEIFPKREFEIRNALKRFAAASQGETIITFHTHSSTGKDASPSPLIIRYECSGKACFAESGRASSATTTCGTNFKSKEALEVLKAQVEGMTHSATKLEEYGTCPFAYFCRRILGIEPPDDITPEVQPKDRGTLIHESLEEFFVTNGKIYNNYISGGVDNAEYRGLVTASVEKAFSDNQKITDKYNKDMVGHLKTRAVNYITAVLENEAEILSAGTQRPSHFELEFNGELPYSSSDPEHGEGESRSNKKFSFSTSSKTKFFKIKGVIDRIDSDNKTFTVIDYKTGDTPSVKSGIRDGTELQMPIYTFMAEKVLKKEPAAALLYSIRKQKRATGIIKKELKENVMGKKQSRITVSNEEWDELIRTGIDTAIRYVEDIKNGRFESAPDKCPGYCDWKDVCRYK